ncbi:MAG: hypothetical protein H0T53_03910 [Herpetosiphonaceae bacterium]|nr:hypothetical protein [Herpetosiphonaceae bacterium]
MHRPFLILLVLIAISACAGQTVPAPPTSTPVPESPVGSLIVYARSVAPGPDYEHYQSDLVVVDEAGQVQRTLPLTNVLDGFATRAPNQAVYRTSEGYFLADAARGIVQSLPMTQAAQFAPLVADQLGVRYMLMVESFGGPVSPSSRVNYLVDLERGSMVELNALFNGQTAYGLTLILSPDEEYVLAIIENHGLAVIPTADPGRWRTLARNDSYLTAAWSADSQSIIYAIRTSTDEPLMRVGIAGGTPTTLLEGRVSGWQMLPASNRLLISDDQGLVILDLASGEQRRIEQCAANYQLIMGASDENLVCPGGYLRDWYVIDMRTGSATLMTELEGSTLRSPEYQRWAVFGTVTGGDVIMSMPTQIVDLDTGRIVVRIENSDIIDVAPDGSAVVVYDEENSWPGSIRPIWVYGSDGSSQLLHSGLAVAAASFSPNGQQILVGNSVYDTDPVLGPISVFDQKGKLIRTLDISGISPLWLEP